MVIVRWGGHEIHYRSIIALPLNSLATRMKIYQVFYLFMVNNFNVFFFCRCFRSSGCDESYWSYFNQLNATCTFIPSSSSSSYENDRITSSIMSFPQLKNVRLFCDQTNHNSKAPTKQNFLCDGKSTSEVIYAHPDFRNLAFRLVMIKLSLSSYISFSIIVIIIINLFMHE